MNTALNAIIAIWPLLVFFIAWIFYRKQNSRRAWTGGPISLPKSFWLAYTTTTWFLLPIVFISHVEFPEALKTFFIFHLASWWIRGVLELVMIYKWYNWTPRYGISHDAFHIAVCSALLYKAWPDLNSLGGVSLLATVFCGIVVFATSAEILFAVMFLNFRSKEEADDNIYFASDDPKWLIINRTTFIVVIIVMTHLVWQSIFILRTL